MYKTITALVALFSMLAPPCTFASCCAAGEALALVRVPEAVRDSPDRTKLCAEYCAEIGEAVSADVRYISPIYGDTESAAVRFVSDTLSPEELIERLLEDGRVIGAAPNRITKLNPPKRAK